MIASWMIYTVVLGAILIGAAHCLELGLRLLGHPTRGIWAGVLVLALALPFLTLLRPAAPSSAEGMPTPTVTAAPRSLVTAAVTLPTFAAPPALDRALLMAWAAGSLLLIGALLHGVGVLQGRRREWHRAEVNGRVVLVAPDLGPAVIGWRRSQVVLPFWALALDPEARDLILLHEEEHIRSHDPALLVGGLIASAAMPWNLPLWYLHRRLRLAIELDCDARVLGRGAEVTRYGEVLLEAGTRSRGSRLPVLAAFAERASQLGTRIDLMTRPRGRRPVPKAVGAASMAVVLLATACAFENPLGVDLTTSERPAQVRVNAAYPQDSVFTMVRMVSRNMAEQMYPGAIARGGIPVEAVIVVTLKDNGHVGWTWMNQPYDSRGMAWSESPLRSLKVEAIQSVEVFRGKVIGIENLGIIVVRLKPVATGESAVTLPLEHETLVEPSGLQQPRLLEQTRPRTVVSDADLRVVTRGDNSQVITLARPPR